MNLNWVRRLQDLALEATHLLRISFATHLREKGSMIVAFLSPFEANICTLRDSLKSISKTTLLKFFCLGLEGRPRNRLPTYLMKM